MANLQIDEKVSIHAPRARGDRMADVFPTIDTVSIHAPRARGDFFLAMIMSQGSFNSRPSCEGRHMSDVESTISLEFQFTPLVRGATL